jgi:hypothetical protein
MPFSLETFIHHNIEKGITVVTDELSSYRSVLYHGYRHIAIEPANRKNLIPGCMVPR